MEEIDPDELTIDERRRIMRSATTPRPIGWISTTSPDGLDNLAPFSNYNNVCTSTPAVMFSVGTHGEGVGEVLKHTAENVMNTGEFVVNVCTEELLDEMLLTAEEVPREESEFDHADIPRAKSTTVGPPRVADAVVNLECTFFDSLPVFDNRIMVGEVKHIHLSDRILTEGQIDMEKVKTIGRIGGPTYTDTGPISDTS